MTNTEKLDNVLLSENAKENFHRLCRDNSFYNWFSSLMPEIVDCSVCEQNTPWHIYNVLDHILISVEEINKLTTNFDENKKRMFAYVMFLHDVGKPKCKQTKQFGNRQVDSFKGHQAESEKIAKRVLPEFGFDEKEVAHMSLLILNHDLFIGIVKNPTRPHQQEFSEKLIKNLVKNFGAETLNEIILISTADNKAQNPKLTAEPLAILQETKTMLHDFKTNQKSL